MHHTPLHPSDAESVVRLMVAFAATAMVGNNRHRNDKPAGFRTHVLVGVGSCLAMLVGIHMAYAYDGGGGFRPDPARIAAQVVTGIGFLGAGAILHQGGSVRGLTTAATLWCSACLGLAAGAGLYVLTTMVTLLMLLSVTVLDRIQSRAITRRTFRVVKLTCMDWSAPGHVSDSHITTLESVITRFGRAMRNLELKTNKGSKGRLVIEFSTEFFSNKAMLDAVLVLQDLPFVESVELEA